MLDSIEVISKTATSCIDEIATLNMLVARLRPMEQDASHGSFELINRCCERLGELSAVLGDVLLNQGFCENLEDACLAQQSIGNPPMPEIPGFNMECTTWFETVARLSGTCSHIIPPMLLAIEDGDIEDVSVALPIGNSSHSVFSLKEMGVFSLLDFNPDGSIVSQEWISTARTGIRREASAVRLFIRQAIAAIPETESDKQDDVSKPRGMTVEEANRAAWQLLKDDPEFAASASRTAFTKKIGCHRLTFQKTEFHDRVDWDAKGKKRFKPKIGTFTEKMEAMTGEDDSPLNQLIAEQEKELRAEENQYPVHRKL